MYKKVIWGKVAKTEDGIILGKEVGSFPGRVFFEDEKGEITSAVYGILDEKGKLHTFCTNTKSCGKTCLNANSPCCRYNHKYQHAVGYYVDIE